MILAALKNLKVHLKSNFSEPSTAGVGNLFL
jgi:hypothetical protein